MPHIKTAKFLPLALVLGGGLLLAALYSQGAVYSWSGGGGTGNWSESANWGYAGFPNNGDTLVFPAGQPRLTNTNNISGLVLAQIRFAGASGGYNIYGNSFTLTNSIQATNTAGINMISNYITLSTTDVLVNVGSGASLTLGGSISGSVGVTKTGAGTLNYATYGSFIANGYTGTTRVNAGLLTLYTWTANDNWGGFAGPLIIGDGSGTAATVRLLYDRQVPNPVPVTVNAGGVLDLNGWNETIGTNLTLSDGTIQTGGGTLTLSANPTITVSGYPSISGRLSVGSGTCTIQGSSGYVSIHAVVSGSANIVKNGTVAVWLYGANTFTGTLTANTGGYIYALNNLALGATNGGTILNDSAGLSLNDVSITDEALTLNTASSYALEALASSVNIWSGPVSLSQDAIIPVGTSGSLDIIGPITGAGGITKRGAGTLRYSGSTGNNYSGNTTVNEGILQLNKSGGFAIASGILTIADGVGGDRVDIVRYTGTYSSQINTAVDIVLSSSGLLDLNGFSDDVGQITLNGGDITLGTGTLTLAGNVTTTSSSSTINGPSGAVSLSGTKTFTVDTGVLFDVQAPVAGAGALVKAGSGTLRLGYPGTYTGLTTVNAGTLEAWTALSLGGTGNGTRVNSGGTLLVWADTTYTNEPLYLNGIGYGGGGALSIQGNGTNSWTGTVALESDSSIWVLTGTANFTLSGVVSNTGGFTKYGPGTLTLGGTTANTYAGTTRVNEGKLVLSKNSGVKSVPGNLVIGDGSGSDVVMLASNNQLALTADVLIQSGGLLECGAYSVLLDTLRGSGTVNFGTGAYLAVGESGGSSTFDGPMTGVGFGSGYTLAKLGAGTFTMNGNATFSAGITHVYTGKLVANGSISSAVTVDSGATLGGGGTVGLLTANGAISPGASPGCLHCSNVTFGASSSVAIEMNGNTACSGYDQLSVVGTVNLTGAALSPLTVDFLPQQGDQFIIVNNDSTDAVTGTFDGLSEGAVISDSTGKFHFRLSYAGSSGNDVVLTMTNQSLTGGAAYVLSGNGNAALETNECNFLNLVINNLSAYAMSGLSATLQSLTPGVVVVQPYSTYPNVPAGYSRTNDAFFQITTQPGFACGDTVKLELQVVTATHGTLKVPVSLPSGVAGSAVRYDNSVLSTIPDLGYVDKTFTVSGITTPLKKVRVSLHITHTADSDLDISLIGPDGTTVNLSSDNGGTSSDYGTDCTDKARTTFDSTASTPITSGTAPFVGIYRPEGSLAVFNEKSGSDVNGTWTLRIADDTAGAVGSIRCCSLLLYPTACTPGSGICELCPDVTIKSYTGLGTPLQTGYLQANNIPSACGSVKACPPTGWGSYPAENFVFRNGPADACITVTVANQDPGKSLVAAAYLGSFDPAAGLCVNYLADAGYYVNGSHPSQSFSFNVSANAVFVVNVLTDAGGLPYTLAVSGGNCRPVLNITQVGASNLELDWTTAAPGYHLEGTNRLNGVPWLTIPPNPPPVVNSKFTVTNAMDSIKFYRLHKP